MPCARAPEGGQISASQAAGLVFAIVLPPAVLYLPSLRAVVVRAGVDGRISMLVGAGTAMLLLLVSWALAFRYPGRTFPEMLVLEWGRLGQVLTGLYVLGLVIHGAFQARAFGQAIGLTLLPRTPVLPIIAFQLVVAVWAARKGIEAIARINVVAAPLMLLGLVTLLILAWRDLQLDRLPPAWSAPLVDILRGAAAPLAWFLEAGLLAHIAFPYVSNLRRVTWPYFLCLGLAGVLLSGTLWISQAVLGVHLARQSIAVVEKVAREVAPVEFFSRVEALYLAVWQPASIVEFAVLIYGAALVTAQLFALREYQSLVLPLGLLMVIGGAFLVPGVADIISFSTQVVPVYAVLFGFGLPLVFLLVSLGRRAGGRAAGGGG
nr:hypothetical protein [Bacillota bacterium]